MSVTAESIYDKFHAAYPDDTIVVYKFTAPGGAISSYNGNTLLDVQLFDKDWLKVYKLAKSSGPTLTREEIKQKVFPFVFDTKNITDSSKRRDMLKESLTKIFPEHNVMVGIFGPTWTRKGNSKGSAYFEKEYGSEVDVILN